MPPLYHQSQDGIITYVVCFMTRCMQYDILIYIYTYYTYVIYIYIEIVGKYTYTYIHIMCIYIYIYYLNSGQIYIYIYICDIYIYIYHICIYVGLWSYVVSKYVYIYIYIYLHNNSKEEHGKHSSFQACGGLPIWPVSGHPVRNVKMGYTVYPNGNLNNMNNGDFSHATENIHSNMANND